MTINLSKNKNWNIEFFTSDGGVTYTLTKTPILDSTFVLVGNVEQDEGVNYNVVGENIVFVDSFDSGIQIKVRYQY